jgi:hypothetical protein
MRGFTPVAYSANGVLMTRTTPPRPVDIATVFPELLAYGRTTTRLHPRPGAPGRTDSSVGGPLLWPVGEPWPVCTQSHAGATAVSVAAERRRRKILAAAWARARSGCSPDLTEVERLQVEKEDFLDIGPVPVPMLAVAQLCACDIPDFAGPAGADLLQVLWCPFDHGELQLPAIVLKWRQAADVTDVLDSQPEPVAVQQYACYLPEPCVLHPERVLEYQYGGLLPEDLDQRIQEWEEETGLSYQYELSIADGWKAGGWADWSLTDPYPVVCDDCGQDMDLLLTIASFEWDGVGSWRPLEDPVMGPSVPAPNEPTQVMIGRGYSMWIFTCPASFDHPHKITEE